jgi:hypothetical protein
MSTSSRYNLREQNKVVPSSEKQIFCNTYYFTIKHDKLNVNRKTFNCFIVDFVNDTYKYRYKLRTINVVFSKTEANVNEIINNNIVSRECIEINDVLYCIKIKNRGNITTYYAQNIPSENEFYNIFYSNFESIEFIFVSSITYNLLIQSDYKESVIRNHHSIFKDVRQQWDWTNPCCYCNFVYLESQKGAFRSKCCANGLFKRFTLPENLLRYCQFENNDLFIKNCYIYNNLLSYGSLGVDKTYDSNYINTQGGSVVLQGRTFLLHRRENGTKALVYYTNGYKNDNEDDRIFSDIQKVVTTYNMNGNSSSDISDHFRVINCLRHEQYEINRLVHQYCSIIDSIRNRSFDEVKVELHQTPMSVYDISHYRTNDNVDPCFHVILKNSNNNSIVHASNGFYETVSLSFI